MLSEHAWLFIPMMIGVILCVHYGLKVTAPR